MGVVISTSTLETTIKSEFYFINLLTSPWLDKKRDCEESGYQHQVHNSSFIEAAKDLPEHPQDVLNWLKSKKVSRAEDQYKAMVDYIERRNETVEEIYAEAREFILTAAKEKSDAHMSH